MTKYNNDLVLFEHFRDFSEFYFSFVSPLWRLPNLEYCGALFYFILSFFFFLQGAEISLRELC